MNYFKKSLITLAVSSVVATAAFAGDDRHTKIENMDDDSWATLTGQVTEVKDDSFTLNYGEGSIEVDLDDGDFNRNVYNVSVGEEVTVIGKIDDDFFDETEIDAASVLVGSQSQPYYASEQDKQWFEEKANDIYWSAGDHEHRSVYETSNDEIGKSPYTMKTDDHEMKFDSSSMGDIVTFVGQIKTTSQWSDEVTLSVDDKELSIDISELAFDPLDDDNMRSFSEGDIVRVKARIEDAMFTDYSAVATSINKI